jgi:hypothetical protein
MMVLAALAPGTRGAAAFAPRSGRRRIVGGAAVGRGIGLARERADARGLLDRDLPLAGAGRLTIWLSLRPPADGHCRIGGWDRGRSDRWSHAACMALRQASALIMVGAYHQPRQQEIRSARSPWICTIWVCPLGGLLTRFQVNVRNWHISEETRWSAYEAVSGPLFHLLFVTL